MGEWIALVSGKDGVGKTTALSYLGLALSSMKKTVLAADFSAGDGGLSLCYHYAGTVPFHYVDVLEGNCRVSDALVRIGESSLYALNAPKNRRISKSYAAKIRLLCQTLSEKFDYVLTEIPPGEELKELTAAADKKLILSTPSALSVADTESFLQSMHLSAGDFLILNRVPVALVRNEKIPPIEEAANRIGLPLIGVVPEDASVYGLPEGNELPRGLRSAGEKAFYRIARRLTGERLPIIVRG